MNVQDGLIYLLALGAGATLLVGLARALDGRPRSRPAHRGHGVPGAAPRPVARSAGVPPGHPIPGPAEAPESLPGPLARVAPRPPVPPLAGLPLAAALRAAPSATPLEAVAPAEPSAADGRSAEERHGPPGAAAETPERPGGSADLVATAPCDPAPAFENAPGTPAAGSGAPPPVEPEPSAEPAVEPTMAGPRVPPTIAAGPPPAEAGASALAGAAALASADDQDGAVTEDLAGEAGPPEPPAAAGLDLIERWLRAYEGGEYASAAAAAQGLAQNRPAGRRSRKGAGLALEQVAAWSILALCRRVLADEIGARVAVEAAMRWAGDVGRPELAIPAARMSARLGRHLLAMSEAAGGETRPTILRLSARWLAWAGAGPGADPELASTRAEIGERLCALTEERVAGLVGRREFGAAYRALREALDQALVPPERREGLRDLLWTSLAGEVGRLIGQALHGRGAEGGEQAMARLAAAGSLVAAVPAEVLSAARREDLERRLWWAHTKLGVERADRGDFEGAIEPLFRALDLSEGDGPRQDETRQALGRAVEGLVEELGQGSLARLDDGDVEAALVTSRRLSALLDRALERGLSQEDLASAVGRRQEVMLQIAGGRRA